MAKTIAEWKKVMTDQFIADATIKEKYSLTDGLTFEQQFSKVSIESILFYVVAFCAWTLDVLLDKHTADITTALSNQIAHRAKWYAQKVLAYQHGQLLPQDLDVYDNTGLTDDQINQKKVIKNVSVVESDSNALTIKIRLANDAIDSSIVAGLQDYVNEIKDCGVGFTVVNAPADYIRLVIDVFYNASILNAQGKRLDGTADTPIADAITAYLQSLRFDGYYSNMACVDAIQQVEGVDTVELKSAQSKYGGYEYQDISARIRPYSGFFKIYEPTTDLMVNYIPA